MAVNGWLASAWPIYPQGSCPITYWTGIRTG